MYVEELIGNDTVNTVPDATLLAFRDHGEARAVLSCDVDAAESVLVQLAEHDIDLEKIGAALLGIGLKQFDEAFVKLLALVS